MDHHSSEDALAILIRKSLESLNHESRICATHGDGDPGSDEVLVSANSIDKETQFVSQSSQRELLMTHLFPPSLQSAPCGDR
jgi:hypothetical protein